MLKNYLLIAFRNLWKHKVYSLINILGLATGFCCCILISIFIVHELSYDRFHSKADRIYRVTREFLNPEGAVDLHLGHVAPPIAPLLKEEFPEVEESLRMINTTALFRVGEQYFVEEDSYFAEKNLFKVFDFQAIKGSKDEMLKKPFCIALTEELAEKYFPGENPIGKTLKWVVRNDQYSLKITGVYKALPEQSHMHPSCLISLVTMENPNIYQNSADPKLWGKEGLKKNWGNNSFLTYILLPEKHDAKALEAKLPEFMEKTFGSFARSQGWVSKEETRKVSDFTNLYLQKLTDIHLYSHLDSEAETNGSILYVYIFTMIGLFILAIASINFINLATARSANRAKEVGIRKVVGAYRGHLILQFLSESIMITGIAMILGIALAELCKPLLSSMLSKSFSFNYFIHWYIPLLITGVVLLVGALAGFYPAVYLSSFLPVKVLKGKIASGAKRSTLRTILVVTQFTISIVLMVSTMIIYQQLSFMRNKELGFNKDYIVNLPLPQPLNDKFESFRNELKKMPAVKELGRSSRIPSGRLLDSFGSARVELKDSLVESSVILKVVGIDHHFVDTYGIKLAAGRNFSKEFGRDDSTAFIINAIACKQLGWASPKEAIGKRMNYGDRQGQVVGVLEDFNFESMHEEVKPMIMLLSDGFYRELSVKLEGINLSEGLQHLEDTWAKFLPGAPFDYEFLDENIKRLYEQEEREGVLFFSFSGLAIFIACLGLFGLASFIAEQRTKEIGIRKVLGASVLNIIQLISSDFVKLVLIANLIAVPIAFYAMHAWLQDFAYRISIHFMVFVITGLLALCIALITISVQIMKVATLNPVNTLRNE